MPSKCNKFATYMLPITKIGQCTASDELPNIMILLVKFGEPARFRTWDLLIKSQLLYQLSYGPVCTDWMPERLCGGWACACGRVA